LEEHDKMQALTPSKCLFRSGFALEEHDKMQALTPLLQPFSCCFVGRIDDDDICVLVGRV
jgi:hypothetical protein